jgi:uncharacterized protein YlxP (DUF503 family)
MVIAYALFDLHLPGCRGLKEKRMIVKSLKTRIRNEFEVSAAEVGDQDLLQRAQLGVAAAAHLHQQGQEWRNVRLYGQERNLMTSSIARMNCFLHGIEDFRIERGDTLADHKLVQGDRLMRFDVVLANPPSTIANDTVLIEQRAELVARD